MDLVAHWDDIKSTFNSGVASSKHCSVATVDADGHPHITPIGFIFLKDDHTAYYFEEYTKSIAHHMTSNKNICLMAVNSGFLYWFRSLLGGQFISPPGVRLYGTLGQLRTATEDEIDVYKRRVKPSRRLKGYGLIWDGLETVREIELTSFKPVQYPKMMSHLWKQRY